MFKTKENLEIKKIEERVEMLLMRKQREEELLAEEEIVRKYFKIWKGKDSVHILGCLRKDLEKDLFWFCVQEMRKVQKSCLDLKQFLK